MKVVQQKEFSYLSVTFFIFSVVAAVFSGDGGGNLPARDGRIHHNTVPRLLLVALSKSRIAFSLCRSPSGVVEIRRSSSSRTHVAHVDEWGRALLTTGG